MSNAALSPYKNRSDRPLLLWCASHTTLAKEEIPLLLEAGFRVVPLLTDMWTFTYQPELNSKFGDEWRASTGLSDADIDRLQAVRIYEDMGNKGPTDEDLEVLNQFVDIAYVTILPNVVGHLLEKFTGSVVFRPFGHGNLNTYSQIAKALGTDLNRFGESHRYVWCPILRTLMEPEDPRICCNPVLLRAFVSPQRLGLGKWQAEHSEPIVIDTIPRINQQVYYREIYDAYIRDYGELPVQILGGNVSQGGEIGDARIVGTLSDDDYIQHITRARIAIYHGQSAYHLHYHPIEYIYLGVPVLFHQCSAIAAELYNLGLSQASMRQIGMYTSAEDARDMARQALDDWNYAAEISQRQIVLKEEVFCRSKALDEARWLRTVCSSQLTAADRLPEAVEEPVCGEPAKTAHIGNKIMKEAKRFSRRLSSTFQKESPQ